MMSDSQRRIPLLALLLLAVAVLLAGKHYLDLSNEIMTVRVGNAELRVEVADNPTARTRGLMYRAALAPDAGMLFVWPSPRQLAFWMKNTGMDLDIGFFDAQGRLLNVATMQAHDAATRHVSAGPAVYALEANAGWFAANALGPGAKLALPSAVIGR
jgi:uncharacterized membrane protein (UPF0127 family)